MAPSFVCMTFDVNVVGGAASCNPEILKKSLIPNGAAASVKLVKPLQVRSVWSLLDCGHWWG